MLATGCQNLGRLNRKLSEVLSVAVSNASDELLNDTPTSSPSPRAEVAMSLVCHFSVATP